MALISSDKKQRLKNSIFAKYFILFAIIILIMLAVLGTSLTLLVNAYTRNENTKLLKANVTSLAESIESTLIAQDMNDAF